MTGFHCKMVSSFEYFVLKIAVAIISREEDWEMRFWREFGNENRLSEKLARVVW